MFLADTFFGAIGDFFANNISKIIGTIVVILVAVLLILIVRIITKKYIKQQDTKRKNAIQLAKIILSIFRYVVIILGIIIVLSIFEIDVLPILIVSAILIIALLIGCHKIISDIVSGICIIFEDYYDVGDTVEINGFKGTVNEIGLRTTKLVNWKNETRKIANSEIRAVTNYSKLPSVGVVEVRISNKEDMSRVVKLLEINLGDLKKTYGQILEGPNVVSGLVDLTNNSATIRITVKTEPDKQNEVERAMMALINELLNDERIKVPCDQVVFRNEDNKRL